VYIETMKDFIFTDAMRQKFGKMSYPELQTCLVPNELMYICQENLPIFTYVPNEDCMRNDHNSPFHSCMNKEY
jgi:hypothetical protein